jgi:1-deoxy-D-xylulose-5-phosphate reductoisomerase
VPLTKLATVTPDEACAHPNWVMGRKISVDSATMMNKGLEVIEAHFLFGLSHENIDVVVHPQSIIHSFAYFDDGSVLSQLGLPDMRTAISYALSHPERHNSGVGMLDLTQKKSLEFYPPDLDAFSCLRLAYDALKAGKSAAGTLSAANEIAVDAFLNNKIGFLEISSILEKTLEAVSVVSLDTLDDVMENDQLSRQVARSIIEATCA